MTYDLLILGSGPAGLAAGIAARGRGKTVLVVGNRWQDSPLARAERIDNYLGLPALSGTELLARFTEHAAGAGVEFLTGKALSIMAWEGFQMTVGSDVCAGKALILAPGVVRQSKYPGEAEYLGRGVSYCATCDGMLFRNRPVTVVGRSGDAPGEANYLRSIGCQVVYVSPKPPEGLDPAIPYVKANRLAVRGDQTVTGLEADGSLIPCAGVFILRSAVAPADLLPGLETEHGVIQVYRQMRTSLPGVFSAGDCTGGPLQVAKAVGEGHVAALSACEYLDNRKES